VSVKDKGVSIGLPDKVIGTEPSKKRETRERVARRKIRERRERET
jgi:hypothetical protein